MDSELFPNTNVKQFRIIKTTCCWRLTKFTDSGCTILLSIGLFSTSRKCKILKQKIKFLGFEYDSENDSSGILPDRLEGFLKLRPPKSLAELNSRIGSFSSFSNFILNLKTIATPLLSLAKADKFQWSQLEAESFENIKMTYRSRRQIGGV